jgi:hypothetical protein
MINVTHEVIGMKEAIAHWQKQLSEANRRVISWKTKRSKPYTELGITRLKCIRCSAPARFQWQICSDGNNYRPICAKCDIALNTVVLKFMGHPDKEKAIEKYTEDKS